MAKQLHYTFLNRSILGIRKFYFPVFLVTAVSIFSAQKAGIVLPEYLNNHVNDFLCLPLVLYIGQFCMRIIRSDSTLQLPISLLLCITVYYAVYFEYYLPNVNARYTGDPVDVMLYFFGMLFFYIVEYGSQKK